MFKHYQFWFRFIYKYRSAVEIGNGDISARWGDEAPEVTSIYA